MKTAASSLYVESPGKYLPRDSVDTRWGQGTRAGFTPLPNALIHSQAELGLTANDLVVALNLLSHWWYRRRIAFPSTAIIVKRTGMKIRTVQRSLKNLQKLELIKAVRTGRGTGYDFEGLIAATERMAAKHEWRSGNVEQRLPTIYLEDSSEVVGFGEI